MLMRQAIHIFKKDVRQFRVAIGVVLALTVVFALTAPLPFPIMPGGLQTGRASSEVLVPSGRGVLVLPFLALFWCYLIARVVHADALADDRQFWLTRPYDRRSLWAAKAIFVLAVVNLPMLFAQAWIVTNDGLPLAPNLAGLLWEQVLLTLVVSLPITAIAAATATLSQFVPAAAISWAAAAIVVSVSPSWGGLGWLRYSVALVVALGVASTVLFLQFIRRKTFVSRTLMMVAGVGGLAAFPFVPWAPFFAIQAGMAGPVSGSPRMELVLPPAAVGPRLGSSATIDLQFLAAGVPDETFISCDAAEVTVETPSHATWRSGFIALGSATSPGQEGCTVRRFVDAPGFFDRVRDQTVRIHTTVYFTVFGDERSTVFASGWSTAAVSRVGTCAVLDGGAAAGRRPAMVWCRSAFRSPSGLVWAPSQHNEDHASWLWHTSSYSPFPAMLRVSPVEDLFQPVDNTPDGGVIIKTARPVAHVRTDSDVRDVRLGDFEYGVARKT
jgi:hypothetical protein